MGRADSYRTATAVSAFEWPQLPNEPVAQTVVLVRSDTFADALAGSALAAAKREPLLLTASGSLNPVTKAEIIRLLPPNATVYLLGGTAAISVGVAATITGMGYHVVRLGGANRYATATLIADAINPHPATVLAATGLDFPDALSAGAAAGSMDLRGGGATVVLTAGGVLPADTKTYLNRLEAGTNPPHITAIGGESVPATTGYPYPRGRRIRSLRDVAARGHCVLPTDRYGRIGHRRELAGRARRRCGRPPTCAQPTCGFAGDCR